MARRLLGYCEVDAGGGLALRGEVAGAALDAKVALC